jgi:hypothetical protein
MSRWPRPGSHQCLRWSSSALPVNPVPSRKPGIQPRSHPASELPCGSSSTAEEPLAGPAGQIDFVRMISWAPSRLRGGRADDRQGPLQHGRRSPFDYLRLPSADPQASPGAPIVPVALASGVYGSSVWVARANERAKSAAPWSTPTPVPAGRCMLPTRPTWASSSRNRPTAEPGSFRGCPLRAPRMRQIRSW